MGGAMISAEHFSHLVLRCLNERIKEILHPTLYEMTTQEIGYSLSCELLTCANKNSHGSESSKKDLLSSYASWLQSTFGWIETVEIVPQYSQVKAFIRRCPFGNAASPQLCHLEASVFGCAAGKLFGFAKVATSGSSESGCHYIIGVGQTPENLALEGPSFPLMGQTHQQTSDQRRLLVLISARERHVLKLLSEGFSDKEIANTLNLSVRTVEGHLANIRSKCGLKSRAALVRLGLQSI